MKFVNETQTTVTREAVAFELFKILVDIDSARYINFEERGESLAESAFTMADAFLKVAEKERL